MTSAPRGGETSPCYSTPASVCMRARRPPRRERMIATRRRPASEPAKNNPSRRARLAEWPARRHSFVILRQPSRAKRVTEATGFSPLAPQIQAKPGMPAWGETKTATPLRRRGLVHASLIVIQNRRGPARDLCYAHAAGVTSLSVYGGRERRSRRAGPRW